MGSIVLVAIYVACELIANITATRPVTLLGLAAPGGVFIYALTFTLIDLVNTNLGRSGARRVVFAAFLANILLALYTFLIIRLPSPEWFGAQDAFATVLGSTPRIVAASLAAYLASSLIDIEIFAFWKERVGGPPWARVLASNAVSTLLDSALFVVLAFGGQMPVLPLILGQYAIKMAVTVVSVPLIYAARASQHP
jgi:queuosine precursor transporter